MNRLACIVFLLSCHVLSAQDAFQFTSGLVVGPCHRYGREAVVQDQLAYQLYTGTLQKPGVGQTLYVDDNGTYVQWQMIKADSAGRFRGNAVGNGYLYLQYESALEQNASIHISGNSMFFFNGEPHGGDIYRDGWMYIPVNLKKGINEILIRCPGAARRQGIQARLLFPDKAVAIRTEDSTLPHIVSGNAQLLWGAVVISNATEATLSGLTVTSTLEGRTFSTRLPDISPMTIRKVGFQFDPENAHEIKKYTCLLQLKQNKKVLDEKPLTIETVSPSDHHSYTFRSSIDGSIQYYSIAPQTTEKKNGSALFLSVHGAGVEAIGQARAYAPKDWGVIVAPTNRRPRGFNWEDWGRLDALEVLELAMERFSPDPNRIYLTGHSMGGHGTWYLGSTYPDKWAAIAPCAGYPTLTGYGSADGRIPQEGRNDIEKMLLRASNPSNVVELARNYMATGIYIHHGDSDRVVSVRYARQMRKILGEFHNDFSYYEYPGGSHWFGSESVDWPPLFDYFKWHIKQPDSAVNAIDFTTANPAISSQSRWASILQQQRPLQYSKIHLNRNKAIKTITGTTENVSTLKLQFSDFTSGDTIVIDLDGDRIIHRVKSFGDLYLYNEGHWVSGSPPDRKLKGSDRNGTFKEPFNHRMVFVYATKGNAQENKWSYNKARYDAEVWYYRGNGSVDIIADRDFNPKDYPDRGVILYGNETTNAAWRELLKGCPIQLKRGIASIGSKIFTGNEIGAFFVWPRQDSEIASIAVISGTGLPGMMATEANQYFSGGSGFPDYLIFAVDMLKEGIKGIKATGFYGNDWSIEDGEWEMQTE